MSQWHRENPELAGTTADPWMQHAGHRAAVAFVKSLQPETYCRDCGAFLEAHERGLCEECKA
jgi:hypothetical protein